MKRIKRVNQASAAVAERRRTFADLIIIGVAAVALLSLLPGCSLMSNELPESSNVIFSRGAMDREGNVVKGVDVAAFPASLAAENLEVSVRYKFFPPPDGSTAEILESAEFTIKRATDPTVAGAVALAKAQGTRDLSLEALKAAVAAALAAGTGGGSAAGAGAAELAGRAIDAYFGKPASPAGS